ncbi:MAG: hypothetical protein ACREFO_13630 [Acetobacteraceae bacterium]
MSIRSLFVGLRDQAGVLVHEVVGGYGSAGCFADAAEDGWWRKAQPGGVAVHGADAAGAAKPDQLSELLVGQAMQAAILFERHEPRNCGHDGHVVNY